tara:strand:- start:2176 stop:2484 length:309 start_codon:yes stop_codon:yes gene_type:complete
MITPIIIAAIESQTPLLISALTVLAGVIGLFWKIIHSNHRETKERGDKLEVKLETNNSQLISLTDEMGELKGRVSLAEEVSPKLDSLAKGIDDLSAQLVRNK